VYSVTYMVASVIKLNQSVHENVHMITDLPIKRIQALSQ